MAMKLKPTLDCLFERLFKVNKYGVFLFEISFFVLKIFLYHANEESDDIINGSTKTLQHSVKSVKQDGLMVNALDSGPFRSLALHQSESNHSDKGLTPETSASKSLYGGLNSHYQPS